jgi:hypothetical protein
MFATRMIAIILPFINVIAWMALTIFLITNHAPEQFLFPLVVLLPWAIRNALGYSGGHVQWRTEWQLLMCLGHFSLYEIYSQFAFPTFDGEISVGRMLLLGPGISLILLMATDFFLIFKSDDNRHEDFSLPAVCRIWFRFSNGFLFLSLPGCALLDMSMAQFALPMISALIYTTVCISLCLHRTGYLVLTRTCRKREFALDW